MHYPEFFDQVPRLTTRDPMAALLGASADGVMDYGYPDAVRLAGHSCPTVATAYWLTCRSLSLLYGDALPERGALRVFFRRGRDEGVTGVMALVTGLLTGAAGDEGFAGLGGQFRRRGLLHFSADIPLTVRFQRVDTGVWVDAAANLESVPADAAMPLLLHQLLDQETEAGDVVRQQFAAMWQERVRKVLLEHRDDPRVFEFRLRQAVSPAVQ